LQDQQAEKGHYCKQQINQASLPPQKLCHGRMVIFVFCSCKWLAARRAAPISKPSALITSSTVVYSRQKQVPCQTTLTLSNHNWQAGVQSYGTTLRSRLVKGPTLSAQAGKAKKDCNSNILEQSKPLTTAVFPKGQIKIPSAPTRWPRNSSHTLTVCHASVLTQHPQLKP